MVALSAAPKQELLVAAASDLSTISSALRDAYQHTKGEHIIFSFGSSGNLMRQIENGAPFDVFLSANRKYVEDLAAEGKVERDTVRVYAVGRLGLWSRLGSFRTARQLAGSDVKRIAIPNPAFAPYGVAARDFLTRQGLWRTLQPRIVYGENVRQALQFAESGNADACITSWTLLYNKDGAVLLPADHAPIEQAGAVVASTKQPELARAFLAWLIGPHGQAVLKQHGLASRGAVTVQ